MTEDSYLGIGQLLRKARDERRLTVAQVSQEMHIRQHYIAALETGDLNILPGLAYVRGYLQAYAAFLDLDRDEILRRFQQVEDRLARKGFFLPNALRREKSPDPGMVSGGLLAALVIYVVWSLIASPHHTDISLVEPFPRPEAVSVLPAATLGPLPACLREQDVYYPPCFRPWPEPQNQLHSLMEIENWVYKIHA